MRQEDLPEVTLLPGRYVLNIPNTTEVKGRSPALMEDVRSFARVTAPGLRDAISGNVTDRDNFDMDFGRRFVRLGINLQLAGIPAEEVHLEVLNVYTHSPRKDIDIAQASDLARAFTDKLRYPPIPQDQAV